MTIPAPVFQVWNHTGSSALGVIQAVIDPVISDVFCNLGSLKFSVLRSTVGAEHILVDADRQLKVVQPGCPDMWFLLDEDSFEGVDDDPLTQPVQVTCRSLAGLFDEAVVYPTGGVGTTPAEYAFTTPTPGTIVTTLVTAAQARGLLQGVTVLGGAVNDATGLAWAAMQNTTYKAGTSLLQVLNGLADSQLLEWRMNARVLEIHRPASGLDRTLTFALRPRRDVLAAPVTRSRRNVATDVLVEGAAGANARRTQALANRRQREAYVSQTSAPSGAINTIGDLYLAAHDTDDSQSSHTLTDGEDTPVPWLDYRPGDRVPTTAGVTGVITRRIAQVACAYGPGTVSLELGSILATAEETFDRKIARLLPGEASLT